MMITCDSGAGIQMKRTTGAKLVGKIESNTKDARVDDTLWLQELRGINASVDIQGGVCVQDIPIS